MEFNPKKYPSIYTKFNTILGEISQFAKEKNIIIYYYVVSSYDNFRDVDKYIENLYSSKNLKFIGSLSKSYPESKSENSLYIPADGHLSESGNEQVASAIYKYINEN